MLEFRQESSVESIIPRPEMKWKKETKKKSHVMEFSSLIVTYVIVFVVKFSLIPFVRSFIPGVSSTLFISENQQNFTDKKKVVGTLRTN